MAEKRMFTKKITDDDNFIALASSAQALYFHLNQGADDDGFNNQVQMAMWKAHASTDDLKVLMAKNYIIRFESGVIVIKHWRMHNTLRKDRYTPTNFQEELRMLGIKGNGSYTLDTEQMEWLPNGCQLVATDKCSKEKNSKEKNSVVESSASATTDCEYNVLSLMGGQLGKGVVLLTQNQQDELLDKLGFDAFNHYVEKLADFIIEKDAKVSNHYATILKWAREDAKV
jgi:hypothetical protein